MAWRRDSGARAYVEIGLDDDGMAALLAMENGTANDIQVRQASTVTLGYRMFSQNQYFQHNYETLGDDVWSGYHKAISRARNRGTVLGQLWPELSGALSDGFVKFVEECFAPVTGASVIRGNE